MDVMKGMCRGSWVRDMEIHISYKLTCRKVCIYPLLSDSTIDLPHQITGCWEGAIDPCNVVSLLDKCAHLACIFIDHVKSDLWDSDHPYTPV